MKKATVSAVLAAPPILAGSIFLTPTHRLVHAEYRLVDEAMIIIPVDNQEYADAAVKLYLDPSGFHAAADGSNISTLDMPEVVPGGGLDNAVDYGVNELVTKVESDYSAGDFGNGNPLYVFGYSQSSVVAGMAEQQLAADHIPTDDLHFVMVGDSASAEGGFLNAFLERPSSNRGGRTCMDAFKNFGADEVLGQTTPDNLYPTDVYSLSGDGWANYDFGLNNFGSVHRPPRISRSDAGGNRNRGCTGGGRSDGVLHYPRLHGQRARGVVDPASNCGQRPLLKRLRASGPCR